jgi:PAS domain S-box-containing protein
LKHWLAAIAPADRALIVTGLRDLAVRGGEYDIEYRRQARDGSRSTIHSRARSIGPVSASGVFALTGVEQRVDAQSGGDERLAGVMKAIIDSNDCPVYAVDSALRLLCSNGAFRTMLGHNQERALATLADCVLLAPHSWPWQKVLENVRRALRGERRIEETQVHDVSGLELWYDMTYNPVLSPDGEVAGVAVSGVNVTARKITGNRQPEPVGPMLPIADPTADL